ncbi:hypothetical protein BDC45DRAFT_610353 [Circinella umbellata]|nr:hypothetical protein BDC45DRAFT_610353 [Circinella umbellata]
MKMKKMMIMKKARNYLTGWNVMVLWLLMYWVFLLIQQVLKQRSYFGDNWELMKGKIDKEYAFKLAEVPEIINET